MSILKLLIQLFSKLSLFIYIPRQNIDIQMQVKKRNGELANLDDVKIINYITQLVNITPVLNHVNVEKLTEQVANSFASQLQTSAIPGLIAECSAALTTEHHHYSKLAGRACVECLHKETPNTFSESIDINSDLFNQAFIDCVRLLNANGFIDNMVVPQRDYQYDIFAVKTLERSYLLKHNNKIVERPQYMIMRVAIAVALGQRDEGQPIGRFSEIIRETYDAMSNGFYTHATPTLFHAGLKKQQLASCYLMTMKEDSISGIYETLHNCALISKGAGGIGLSISQIRPSGSGIAGTNGTSNGLCPMLKVFNDTARYVDQGGGKRKGSFAIWLEPWHPDVETWLDLKKNHGDENARARDLFYGLWVPDLFMKRVKENKEWSMFCPHTCPGLQDTWGEEFEALYRKYEHEGKAHKTINAQELWLKICDSQIETGTPYLMYKDSCNRKSNQQNLGTIRSSNLCCEVVEYTSPDETAVCTLASLALPKCLAGNHFEHSRLEKIARLAVRNLNAVIDINTYPVVEAELSNKRHRPIGIGIQGLHDVFQRLNMPYDSPEAEKLNAEIFETIYYATLSESMLLAKADTSYSTFKGSPASLGILQFDMWGVTPSTRYDWDKLKNQIKKWGLRNSLLVAPMPTASTAQILGNTESFEPRTSNLYTRRVLAGEYMVVNPHLQDKLVQMGVWNEENRRNLIANRGSVQGMNIPQEVKDVFKTVWEMSQKALINLSVSRSPYICQSQSLNLYLESPTRAKLSSMGFYAWSKGLKTGQYYLRSQPKARPIQFTVVKKVETGSKMDCEEDVCIMCSS